MTESAEPADSDEGRRLAVRLLVAAAVCVSIAAVVYVLMIRTKLGQRFDNAALVGSLAEQKSTRVRDIFFLQRINAVTFAAVLLGIAGLGVLRGRPRAGVALAMGALCSVLVTDVLKYVILPRPDLVYGNQIRPDNTFPSGHTATAIGCALALVVLSPPLIRGVVAVLTGGYAWIVAADVQTAGWHRPSDAIGAAFVTFAVVAVAAALLARARPLDTGRRTGHFIAYPVLAVVWIVSAITTAVSASRAVAILLVTRDSPQPPFSVLEDAYRFSVNLTVVVVVSLLICLLLILGRYDLDGRPTVTPGSSSSRP